MATKGFEYPKPTFEQYRKFDEAEIRDIFSYHAPSQEQRADYEKINEAFIQCALTVVPLIPDGPGKTLTVRALADARMKANAAVALEGKF
jgi:hypothetical protein